MNPSTNYYLPNITLTKEITSPSPVACYIRVSTQEQRLHGYSLDAQRDKLAEYARLHNLNIVGWYEDEGVSGRKLIKQRPALQRMLKDAQSGLFERIIFIKLDRFFRSVAEYHECMKLISPVVWTATEEQYDLTTANGRAFVNMKLTIAELEADQTGERIRLVNEYKIKNGQALTGAKNQGLAFTVWTDAAGIKRVVPDPATKDMVMDFIEHFRRSRSKRASPRYINGKYNMNISYTTAHQILTDTKLYGYYRGNPDYCAGYIDKAVYDELQGILASNYTDNHPRHTYLFKGLIPCPSCGRLLSGKTITTSSQFDRYGKENYNYSHPTKIYRCTRAWQSKACDFLVSVNEAKLEKQLLAKRKVYTSSDRLAYKNYSSDKERQTFWATHINKIELNHNGVFKKALFNNKV